MRNFSAAVNYNSDTYGSGFLTTGHAGFTKEDLEDTTVYIKCDGETVGVVRDVNHDGYDDTAFVEFYNQYTWDGTITNYSEEFSRYSIPHENAIVKLRGYLSDPYVEGEVYDESADIYNSEDGYMWHDLLEIDHGIQHGDSGGACLWGRLDGGRTSIVCGVISQGDSTRTYVVKSTNIADY